MGIGSFFQNMGQSIGSWDPQQKATMMAIAAGASPNPRMTQSLLTQSQSIMQAIEAEKMRKAQEAMAQQEMGMRRDEGRLDREQRVALLDRELGHRENLDKIQTERETAREQSRTAAEQAYRSLILSEQKDRTDSQRSVDAERKDVLKLQADEKKNRIKLYELFMEKGDTENAMRALGISVPQPRVDPWAMNGGIGGMTPGPSTEDLIRAGQGQ